MLECRYDPKGNVRPWDRTLYIKVVHGFLKEGDTISVRFGVTDHGSPGMRLQTFCEDSFEFHVLVDPIATFTYQPLIEQPKIKIVPGERERFLAVIPTLRRAGETFALKFKGEDRWGNPSDKGGGAFTLRANVPVSGLPETVGLPDGSFSAEIPGLSVTEAGDLVIELLDQAGNPVAETNPLRIVEDCRTNPLLGRPSRPVGRDHWHRRCRRLFRLRPGPGLCRRDGAPGQRLPDHQRVLATAA